MHEAKKDDTGKLRYDLIPWYPMQELARVYTIGANKYGDYNWRKGMKWGRIVGALFRHFWAWIRGEVYDLADGQHHLASVLWCAVTLMEYERLKLGENDLMRSNSQEVQVATEEVPNSVRPYVFVSLGDINT